MFGKFEVKFDSILKDANGNEKLVFSVPSHERRRAGQVVEKVIKAAQGGKDRLTIEVKQYRERRSLDANAYFHKLVSEIADKLNLGLEEVKKSMVLEYGAAAEESGEKIIAAIPKTAEVEQYYPYAKWIGDFTAKNGTEYSQYLLYKRTHTLDTKEMYRLIQGVIHEAEQLGIETRTPEEILQMEGIIEQANTSIKN